MHLLIAALLTWSSWHTSAVVQDRGYPIFTVDGKPFFVYGAAFFYERIPRPQWRADLQAYRKLGINTIDLYVMWNWHEPDAATVDFDGHTNPRRDLKGLMQTIHELGYKVILRPGPVIRNEWRNGGYPWWLLERPQYNMPLHDVLEGRYPATATYQNQHADAAANEWLHNATHLTESQRWLGEVFREVEPWSHDVIAVALDDDQGAYIDNDTWPAPHWHRYMDWLKGVVRAGVGSKVPLFINTFQMKVTASAPVWAWGNWYQSDAYSIGDHDIDQLAFSTGLLQTQSAKPVMTSEFQAGWLQGADQVAPRAADPTNTTIALHEMLQYGARGVVNFPVQDTVNPPGWEAPWANHDYAWDAAIGLDGETARYRPTQEFGRLIAAVPNLASMHVETDATIAWLGSAYGSAFTSNAQFARLAEAAIEQLHRCRALALTCGLVDLRFASQHDVDAIRRLVLPSAGIRLRFDSAVARRIAGMRAKHVSISRDAAAFSRAPRANGGVADSAVLAGAQGDAGVLDVFNASYQSRVIPKHSVRLGRGTVSVGAIVLPPRSAADVLLSSDDRSSRVRYVLDQSRVAADCLTPCSPGNANRTSAYAEDFFNDGTPTFVLQNEYAQAVVSADAGARSFLFRIGRANAFASIGAGRDDVAHPLAPSTRDYIAAYTHPIPAGTFNRSYDCRILDSGPTRARVRCTYTAADLAPAPVRFEKTYELDANSRTMTLTTSASADAFSLSAVTDKSWLGIECRDCQIVPEIGYRLVRVRVNAGQPQTVDFTFR